MQQRQRLQGQVVGCPVTGGNVDSAVFADVLKAAAESFKAHGFKTIVLLGDSGPNQAPQQQLAADLSRAWSDEGVRVINTDTYYAANGQVELLKSEGETDASIGQHASIRDTSELMAVLPEGIRADKLAADSDGVVGAYVHGGRIGVLVDMKGGNVELARGVAMHVAAMNPPYNKASDVPAEFVAKEKEIELAKMTDKDKAKPAEILEKIIGGKVAKILNDNTLYGQPYVVDTNMTVEAALKAAKADVASFHRIAVGEGIEKVVEDYAAEVAKAMQV